jgi:peptide/nickel transport system permease protein
VTARLGPRVRCGLLLIALLLALAFGGPYLTSTGVDVTAFRRPPSAAHWLGTTPTGRDMCAVTLRGLRESLVTALLVAVSATGLAAITGAVAGYAGGWADRVSMGAVELLLVVPPLLLVATIAPALRLPAPGPLLALFLWTVTARVVRGATLSLRQRGYVVAARHLGVPPLTIVLRHIVPHLGSLLVADATLNVSAAVIGETSLSYLGLGVRPPDVSLGTLIADGAPAATAFPWLFLPPVIVLTVLVLAVNLTGDGLRSALDPGGSS